MQDAPVPPPEGLKLVIDAISAGTVVGALMGILPAIAAIFTIIWTSIRIYETDTVQSLVGKIRKRKTK